MGGESALGEIMTHGQATARVGNRVGTTNRWSIQGAEEILLKDAV